MIWKENRDISYEEMERISSDLDVNYLLTKIIMNRKNDKESVRLMLKDWHESIIPAERLVNGQAIADVITRHILNGSKIKIHADYDADGLNSGYIMYETIREVIKVAGTNATVEVYFPERINGYGLSFAFAEELLENKGDEDILVITVDNGVAQIEQIKLLQENGIEVIVTDHHMSKETGVPNCLICDPHNAFVEQDDTFKHLCGAGVAFKVGELLQKNFGYHDMNKFVPYVAMATITDMMPLHEENVSFIRYGLDIINSNECPLGIKIMKEFLGIDTVNPAHIGWEIGPRLNACGRMNNTKLGGKLFLEEDEYILDDIVNEIELINEARKDATKVAKALIDKMNFDNDQFCIVVLEEAPEGIVGIIASKAVESFNKPSMVVTEGKDGICKGSARSANGIDLHALFNQEMKKGNLINFGGHSEAAGVAFEIEKMNDLRESLNNTINEMIVSNADNLIEEDKCEEVLMIDECIEINHINIDTFNLINEIAYNRTDFTTPVFALTDCIVEDFVPTKTNPDNIWLTVKKGRDKIKLWCKGMTNVYKEKGCPKTVHLAGHIEKNFMNGRPYTFKVIDIADAS